MNLESLVGQTLDEKYRIEKELGRGGMGAVYLSTHVGTERPVALKVIVPQFMERAEFVERFRREARAAGRLRHPNVVDVTDFGFADTPGGRVAYLVMEYLDGCTLGEILEEEKQLPLAWTLDILEQVSSAIHEAHLQGIIHRDLKPDNIWLEPNQRGGYTVKVLDFGIAKLETESPAGKDGADDHENEIDISIAPNIAASRQTQAHQSGSTVSGQSQSLTISDSNLGSQTAAIAGEGETISLPLESSTQLLPATSSAAASATAAAGGEDAGTLIQSPIEVQSEAGTAILQPAVRHQTVKQANEPGTKILSQVSPHVETKHGLLEKKQSADLTRVGAVLGTPLYMSPEQCRGEKLTPHSDIYSLGVIAYQMLSGKTPFAGDYLSVMQAHKQSAPPGLEAKKVPKKVKKVINSALAKEIENRPPTARAFTNELRAHSEGFGVLLQKALVIYGEHLPKFLALALIGYSPVALMTIFQITVSVLSGSGAIGKISAALLQIVVALGAFFFGILCGYLVLGTSAWLVTQILAAPLRPVKLRPAFSQARKNWKALAVTGLLSSVLTTIGYAFCFVPGIILGVIWSLAAPVVMMENLRGRAALKRSKILVKRSLRTAAATTMTMFLVPILSASLVAYVTNRIVKSYTDAPEKPPVVKIQKNKDLDDPPAIVKEENSFQVSVNGEKINLNDDNPNRQKDMSERIGSAANEALSQILILPISTLIGSFFAIVIALLYLKTRQAGGDSMQELFSQFDETDNQTERNWQKRVHERLVQSGRISSRGESLRIRNKTTKGSPSET